jgi:hypothetical protein
MSPRNLVRGPRGKDCYSGVYVLAVKLVSATATIPAGAATTAQQPDLKPKSS